MKGFPAATNLNFDSYSRKRLKFTIKKAQGGNVGVVEGLRAQVDVQYAGGGLMPTANVKIYGLSEGDMNDLTTLSMASSKITSRLDVGRNTITIEAGDDEKSGMTTVFIGDMINSWAVYSGMPDVYLYINAITGGYIRQTPIDPYSEKDKVKVVDLLNKLADKANVSLVIDDTIDTKINNPYLVGTIGNQIRIVCETANLAYGYDMDLLIVVKQGAGRDDTNIPLINSTSGLIGYPTFDNSGISFECLYNPAIRFKGLLKVEAPNLTSYTQQFSARSSGFWIANSITYNLESEAPGGSWKMLVHAVNEIKA